MKWDIFSGRKREQEGKIRDEISNLVKGIERFAPRKYRSQRASYYYNYQLLDAYLKPLFALLEVISQEQRLRSDVEDFICDLFMNLKDFYDLNRRLSTPAAIQDKRLLRKLCQILDLFYGKEEIRKGEVVKYLEKLNVIL